MTIPTGIAGVDGREQKLTEHLCDHPGCPNIAVHVVGVARELSLALALCAEHTALSRRRRRDDVQT